MFIIFLIVWWLITISFLTTHRMRYKDFKPVLKFVHHGRGGRVRRRRVDLSLVYSSQVSHRSTQPAVLLEPEVPPPEFGPPTLEDLPFYKNKGQVLQEWKAKRKDLFEAYVSSSVPQLDCTTCHKPGTSVVICDDCGPMLAECIPCSRASHALRPLHDTYVWDVSVSSQYCNWEFEIDCITNYSRVRRNRKMLWSIWWRHHIQSHVQVVYQRRYVCMMPKVNKLGSYNNISTPYTYTYV